jgi:hypothetical protein
VDITYLVTAHQPYYIRHYSVDIPEEAVRVIAEDERCKVQPGAQFSTEVLDAERERIAAVLGGKIDVQKLILDEIKGTHK